MDPTTDNSAAADAFGLGGNADEAKLDAELVAAANSALWAWSVLSEDAAQTLATALAVIAATPARTERGERIKAWAAANVDPVVWLGARLDEIDAKFEAIVEDDEEGSAAQALLPALNKVEEQICVTVPLSLAGLRRSAMFLQYMGENDDWSDDMHGAAIASIIAGIDRLLAAA